MTKTPAGDDPAGVFVWAQGGQVALLSFCPAFYRADGQSEVRSNISRSCDGCSPEKRGEVILERRRAAFASTGYETVCKADPETTVLADGRKIRLFLIETGYPAAMTALVMSGFEPCQWEVFVNNTVPGHQFN